MIGTEVFSYHDIPNTHRSNSTFMTAFPVIVSSLDDLQQDGDTNARIATNAQSQSLNLS